jgi:esterase/lipase superfamily enzyme
VKPCFLVFSRTISLATGRSALNGVLTACEKQGALAMPLAHTANRSTCRRVPLGAGVLLATLVVFWGCAKQSAEKPATERTPPATEAPASHSEVRAEQEERRQVELARQREAVAREQMAALKEVRKKQAAQLEGALAGASTIGEKTAASQRPVPASQPSPQANSGNRPQAAKSAPLVESPGGQAKADATRATPTASGRTNKSLGLQKREAAPSAVPEAPQPPALATLPAPPAKPSVSNLPPPTRAPSQPIEPAPQPPALRSEATPAAAGNAAADKSARSPARSPTAPLAAAKRPENADQFTVVRVFYGTDRAAVDVSVPAGFSPAAWYWFTSSVAGLTIALALACWWFPASRLLRGASACGLLATAILGLTTFHARQRAHTTEATARKVYGNSRGVLELGSCNVSIPKGHTAGVVERPSILRLQFSENPLKHVVLEAVREQSPDDFYAALKSRIASSNRKEAFVFVHGFNVSFDSAARRTAQIAYDLKFDGAPIFYSWPSYGGLLGYTIDETNVMWTVPHLKQFLVDVAQRSGARDVHLVAHSMGNRALTSALRELFYELNERCPKFREVVLTAPDIDADVFRRDLAPALVRTAERVTLYASSNDEALVLSKKVHGYPRAGDSGAELIVLPGMDTIDVSTVDTSLLGHSYYGNNLTVLADLFDVLHESKPADRRPWLSPVQAGTLRYWVFKRIQEAATGRERL